MKLLKSCRIRTNSYGIRTSNSIIRANSSHNYRLKFENMNTKKRLPKEVKMPITQNYQRLNSKNKR